MGPESLTKKESVQEKINQFLQYEKLFENPPQVDLEIKSVVLKHPETSMRDIAISTAKQCYGKGVTEIKPQPDEASQKIGESTLEAGHHTTREHAELTWKINGVSRSTAHDVFHSFPFYNTSQQSQRYVEVKEGSYLVPTDINGLQREIFLSAANITNKAYFEMIPLLVPEVRGRIVKQYPEKFWKGTENSQKLDSKVQKLSQEIARYLLPIGQQTTLDYSLNEISLLRLWRATDMKHFTEEAKLIVAKMITEVGKVDPSIYEELDMPISVYKEEEEIDDEYLTNSSTEIKNYLNGNSSIMCPISQCDRSFLAMAVRNINGIPERELSDEEALSLLMDPEINPMLADTYETGMHDSLTKCLELIEVKFITGLSHTADSQRQRQRMTPGSNRTLEDMYSGEHSYYTPMVIRGNERLQSKYDQLMKTIFENVDKALEAGLPKKYAHLLLPNALKLHVFESGNLFNFIHRWKQRSCWKAQEEIFYITLDQMKQTLKNYPAAVHLLQAPCGIRKRAGIEPKCPEGDQWCGGNVFNMALDEYSKRRLI